MFERDYLHLVETVTKTGRHRESRAGRTLQLFGTTLTADLRFGFPMLTTRKMYPRGVLGELAAFLKGASHVSEFHEQGCHYWDQDAARWGKDGYVGRIYGVQWRRWAAPAGKSLDQLVQLVTGLATDPYGRRHILTAWNPGELDDMCLPPCHIFAQFNVGSDQSLDCIVYMRSVDLCLGLPSDLVLYASLQHLIAQELNLRAARLTFMMGDSHIYENHLDAWSVHRQRQPGILPRWDNPRDNRLFRFNPDRVAFANYSPHKAIKYPLN